MEIIMLPCCFLPYVKAKIQADKELSETCPGLYGQEGVCVKVKQFARGGFIVNGVCHPILSPLPYHLETGICLASIVLCSDIPSCAVCVKNIATKVICTRPDSATIQPPENPA